MSQAIFRRRNNLKWNRILPLIGLADDMEVKTRADFDKVERHYKSAMVVARNNNNEERVKVLSNVREFIKRKRNGAVLRCFECGEPCQGDYCQTHRNRSHESTVRLQLISTPSGEFKVAALLEKLGMLQEVGDMITIRGQCDTTIHRYARHLGMKVKMRNISGRPKGSVGSKEEGFNVWRTDGKSTAEVNAIIQARLKKEGNKS